jgi:hypothetical protein
VLDPDDLYVVAPDAPSAEDLGRPVLLRLLDGFVDAGATGRLVCAHLLATLEHETVATFDADQLHDYRSRRPPMIFREDHWDSYDAPALLLHVVRDVAGTSFLLLEGPEPDVQWERFAVAVQRLVERFGVRLTVGVNGIPMGVPHTRPVSITVHQTRPGLLEGYEPWLQSVQVPASAGNLVEFRLGRAGHDGVGFAVHVPHYVAQSEYPAAAVAALDSIERATGLSLPSAALAVAATDIRAAIDEQVRATPEVATIVAALEDQYDAIVASRGRDLLTDASARLPSADELGAELERYLAEQGKRDSSEG